MAESKQQPMVPIPGRRARGGPGAFVNKEKPKDIKNTVKRLLQYFAKEKKQIVILFLIVGLSVICNVLAPAYQSNAINYMKDRRFEKIPGTLWVMFSLYLIYGICNLFQGLISAALSQNIVKRMRDELFDKIIHLPVKYLDTHTHGDIMSRMTNDVENISNVIAQSLSSLFSGVLTIIGTVVIMVYYSWQLALLSLSTVILTILATKYMSD